jgi:hypothetical protein
MPIVPPCFSDIELDYAVLAGRVFPKIRIYDQIVPYYYNPSSDFFILEKYVIDPNDPVQMQVLENVIVGQITLYYMSATAYMSSFIWMASEEYDLGVEPERIDISRTFLAGTPYVIDLNAEIGTTLYIYRISSYYRGREWASHYVCRVERICLFHPDSILMSILARCSSGVKKGPSFAGKDLCIVGTGMVILLPRVFLLWKLGPLPGAL